MLDFPLIVVIVLSVAVLLLIFFFVARGTLRSKVDDHGISFTLLGIRFQRIKYTNILEIKQCKPGDAYSFNIVGIFWGENLITRPFSPRILIHKTGLIKSVVFTPKDPDAFMEEAAKRLAAKEDWEILQ